MHIPYSLNTKHNADFRVKYKFRSFENGGRFSGPPFQGIRCDFSLEGQKHDELFQIWPEFEDQDGALILENDIRVNESGTARMWIINPKMRLFHLETLKIGQICYFREGNRLTADCEIISFIDLKINPKN